MLQETVEALRWLILPVQPACEEGAYGAAKAAMDGLGIAEFDQPGWLRAEQENWASGKLTDELKEVVSAFIEAAHPEVGHSVALKYWELYKGLKARFGMSHDSARRLLNQVFLIRDLTTRERMAASQVAVLLDMRDASLGISWREVKYILTKLGIVQELSVEAVESQYEQDCEQEQAAFADSEFAEISRVVGEKAANLGFPDSLEELLNALFCPETQASHAPYLLILHHQCATLAFHDAFPSFLYEFSPRGSASLWLLQKYPFAGSGNAFLNNAKAVAC